MNHPVMVAANIAAVASEFNDVAGNG